MNIRSFLLAAALSATPSGRPVVVITPNDAPLAVGIELVSDDGDASAAAEARTALEQALHLSPPFEVAAPGLTPDLRVRVALRRAGAGLSAHAVVTRASGERVLDERLEGPPRPRALALRLADRLRARELGASPVFSTRLAAVRRTASGGRELVTLDPLGGDLRAPRRDGVSVAAPAWERDGRTVLYTAWRKHPELWSLDTATGEARPVVALGSQASNAAPSPRGDSLVFSAHVEGNADLFRLDRGRPAPVRLTSSPAIDTLPSWQRDGSELVFQSSRAGLPQLFALSASGGEPRRLTFEPGTEFTDPAAHPLGDRVACSARVKGETFQLRVLRFEEAAGESARTLDARGLVITPPGGCEAGEPAWSPEGDLLVFTETCDGAPHLVVATPDGARRVQLPVAGLESAAWGPIPSGR